MKRFKLAWQFLAFGKRQQADAREPDLPYVVVDESKVAEYRIGFAEAVRGITQQQQVLDELRSRASALFAVSAVAASFLGGVALRDGTSVLGWIAMGFFVVLGVITLWMLLPRSGWGFRVSGKAIIDEYIEHGTPAGEAETLRYLTLYLERYHTTNAKRLDGMFDGFQLAGRLLLIEIVMWLLDLGL